MSLINAMLQDLDRRQALGTEPAVAAVRASAPPAKPKREWFWHTLAALMAVSVAWVGWVAFQVMPRPIVTKLALSVEEAAHPRPQPAAEILVPVTAAAPAEPAPTPVVEPAPAPTRAGPFETLRLATELQSPPKAPPAKPAPAPVKAVPVPAPAAPKATAQGAVDKHDRAPSGSTAAANDFRRAVALLNLGRVAEAQQLLAGVLKIEPGHANARQVYVALLVEQGRVEPARRLLEDGLALSPGHAAFALTLARIHAEQRDYHAALGVLNKVMEPALSDAHHQALRGAVLQRLGRHAEAVEAYQKTLRVAPHQATSWLGLAISLEALNLRPEAADAYRRAVGAGPLAAEARDYAETRAAALR